MRGGPFVRWFADITLDDVPLVGGKNASLGELYRELSAAGVRVPNGFAVTADAYAAVIEAAALSLTDRGRSCAGSTARTSARWLRRVRRSAALIESATWPPELVRAVSEAYAALEAESGPHVVRRGAVERDGRGPARGELRRPAGDVPRRARRGRRARRVPAVLRLAVHRSRHRLSRRARLRSPRRRASRSASSAWCGSDLGGVGRHVHARPRQRLSRRRPHQRRLWPGRGRRGGQVDPDEFCVFKPTLRGGRAHPQASVGRKDMEARRLGPDGRPAARPTVAARGRANA